MRKKSIFTVLIIALMAICCAVGNLSFVGIKSVEGNEPSGNEIVESSRELQILQSDIKLTQNDQLSRIRADLLKENGGYRAGDTVSAIIELEGDAVIDSYLSSGASENSTVREYAETASGATKARRLAAKQDKLISQLKSSDLIDSVENRYSTVINAVSVKLPYGNIEKVESLDGVRSVILSDTYNRPQEAKSGTINSVVNDVDVYETGIFDSSDVEFTGKGTAVAVLDSGFDCSHEVFATQPRGELWLEKTDISGVLDQTNAAKTTSGLKLTDVWYSNKIPFTYDYGDKDFDVFPYDNGHGTHVAGIIGGKSDTITGVAVDTQLVLMKVFPDFDEGAETDDILAALEDAVLLGVDCINMSLGTSCGFTREEDGNKINEVYDKIKDSGISLLVAASNSYSSSFSGPQGNTNFVTNPDSSTVGAPSTYESALSVASISGVKSSYLLANDEDIIFFTESSSITGKLNKFVEELFEDLSISGNEVKELEYVTVPGYGSRSNYTDLDVKGKVALVRRGETTFEDKALRAKNAGAVACIIYNNVEGNINMSMGKTDHIPTISITKEMGVKLAAHDVGKLAMSRSYTAGPFMSDFSSWGPTPSLELKPEITAHGGEIKSSIPGGEYDNMSGTSMATPNLCGVVVLIRQFLKEKFPDYTQKQIVVLANQMLMSTATIVLNEEGNPYSPRKQGAGLASLYNVVNTEAYLSVDGIDKTKLELKDDPKKTGVYDMDFNVVNISDKDVEYSLSLIGMTETVSTSDDEHVAEKGTVLGGKYNATVSGNGSLRNGKISVKAGKTAKVSIKYTLSSADKKMIDEKFPNGMYVEGFVKLANTKANGVNLNVPFLAFYGDWTRAPMLDKTYYEVESEAHNASIDEDDKIKADYVATTPYGSYFLNYIVPLGTYLYDVPTGYEPIPATEDHIAVGEDLSTIDGFSTIYTGLLRGARKMTYTITDKLTGETIKEFIDYNAIKAYSNGSMAIPYFEQLNWKNAEYPYVNNREYEFKMVGELDYEDGGLTSNLNNTFKFDFTFDNEAPIIKSAVYEKEYDSSEEEDRYYVTLTVSDNHYVQSIMPIVFTSTSSYAMLFDEPIPVYGEKGKETAVRIEITDLLKDSKYDALIKNGLGFVIDDYALNSQIFICQLPGTRGRFAFTKNGETDGAPMSILTVYRDEVADLTKYLSTTDTTVDADKDYLKYLSWSSSNTDIVEVAEGQVRGISVGRATVTVTEQMNGLNASLIINVKERPGTDAANGEANVSEEAASPSLGKQSAKTAAPQTVSERGVDVDNVNDAKIESLRFTYFDTLFAYSRAAQTSMIGETGSKVYISSLSSRLAFYPGEKIKLAYEISPWYVSDKYPATFSSSNTEVAIVEQDGTITALKKGSCNITLKLEGSTLSATLGLTVNSEFIIDDSRTLVAYKGLGGKVTIPDDEGILYIGAYAFCLYDLDTSIEVSDEDYDANKIPAANTSVTEIVIPDGVEEIRKYAFYNCSHLKKVTILGHVKYIRDYAFYNDSDLAEINLDNVYSIGRYAFYGCSSLDNIKLTKTYAIAAHGFENCTSLSAVDLSALRNTGESAFEGCESLASVTLNENTKLAARMFASSGLKTVDIYERIEIPEYCFAMCKSLTRATLHNDLVAIGTGAFCRSDLLTEVVVGKVERIDEQAFYLCVGLQSFKLPDCEVKLGRYVFLDCEKLTGIELAANTSIDNISASVFRGTALANIKVADGNSKYKNSSDGKLLLNKAGDTVLFAVISMPADYTVGAGYKNIAPGAFGGTKIKNLTITSADTVIGDYAFDSCEDLVSVVLPNGGIKSIGLRAFTNCAKLESVKNLVGVLNIGNYAFAETGIKNAEIGKDAVCGEGAFFRSELETVKIGANATFGVGAFQNCARLKSVEMSADGGISFGSSCFMNDAALATIDLGKVAEIADQTFYGCTSLKEAVLSQATSIGKYAFADCSALTKVEFPKVETIGEGAFAKYNRLTGSAPPIVTLTLPSTLTSMDSFAFADNVNLKKLVIQSGKLDKIASYAFQGCTALTEVTLPDSVKKIEEYAFVGNVFLTKINLGKVEEVGDMAFNDAQALATVDLSSMVKVGIGAFAQTGMSGDLKADRLTEIGAYAFQNTYASIKSFTAPNLKKIGMGAFAYNNLMTEFVFSGDVEEVDPAAFYGCTSLSSFYFMNEGMKLDHGEINGYAQLIDGVLYTNLKNGNLALSSIPGGKNIETFELKERTVIIDSYAGNGNKNIKKIVLADSLRSIGNHAFDEYDNLQSVEFKSFTAPALECDYDSEAKLEETDPGYDLLHNQFQLFEYELCYFNFKGLVGKFEPIKMILPSNDGIVGYDSVIFQAYFGSVDNAETSGYIAMDEHLNAFMDGAKEISRIETFTLSDEKLINKTISELEATAQKLTDYGYSEEESKTLIDKAYAARDAVNALKPEPETKPQPQPQTPDDGDAFDATSIVLLSACIVCLALCAVSLVFVARKRNGGKK